MRFLIATGLAYLLFTGAAEAKDMKACSADWKAQKVAKTAGSQTHKQFMTTCLAAGSPGVAPSPPATSVPVQQPGKVTPNAGVAPSMAAGSAPTGATAKCKDGTFSMSKHHSGSCSHHGGVAQFLQ